MNDAAVEPGAAAEHNAIDAAMILVIVLLMVPMWLLTAALESAS